MALIFRIVLNKIFHLFRPGTVILVQVFVSDSKRIFLVKAQLLSQKQLFLKLLGTCVLLCKHVKASYLSVCPTVMYESRVKHAEKVLET